jgi:hypothetical protein
LAARVVVVLVARVVVALVARGPVVQVAILPVASVAWEVVGGAVRATVAADGNQQQTFFPSTRPKQRSQALTRVPGSFA